MPTRTRKYKPKITHRARKLVQNVAKGMTAKQAAIQAGYSPKNASQSAHQVLSRLEESIGASHTTAESITTGS
jgi:DNA-binding NarL/FixJ family response regulator